MKHIYSLSCLALFGASLVLAAPPDKSGDDDWASLQASVKQAGGPQGAGKAAAVLIAAADQCRDFAANHPTHKRASDSQCLEAMMLERGWQAGDESQKARRTAAVEKETHDKSVTPELRAELIALVDGVTILKTPNLSRDQVMSAHADSARGIIKEFPTLPVGCYALASVAHDSTEAQATAIAHEILALPQAPWAAKLSAQTILDRVALVGKPLRVVIAPIPGATAAFASAVDHATVIYTWTADDFVAIARAKTLAKKAPAGTAFVGICLDAKIDAAKAAAANALPGTQLYDPLGRKAAIAQALKLTDSGMIYVADSAGVVRTVTGHNNFNPTALFAGL